jgi:hypothetical protein
MTQEEKDFHLKEFECLRKEIEFTLTEFHSIQRYVILASGAVWAWLFTQCVTIWEAWAIPLLFAGVGLIRHLALLEQLKIISSYIQQLEQKFAPEACGYEYFYRLQWKKWKYAPYSNALVWSILPVLALVLTIYGPQLTKGALANKPPVTCVTVKPQ